MTDSKPERPMIRLAQPAIGDDERRAVLEALESGQLAQGPRVAAFERAFAEYIGTRHAIAVNSGTAALHLALAARNVAGGEVIVPAFSFPATATAVLHAGARPVFVDVRDDFNIDPDAVERAITPRTRAVVAVHLYGQMCAVRRLRALCDGRGLALIEDVAQAAGASLEGKRAGSFGDGCFSFYATKNLTTGEGGMITTDDDALAERCRMLRSQGERERYVTEELGYNYRMTEMAAALGDAQIARLDGQNARRAANAGRLNELLAPLEASGALRLPREAPPGAHVWHQYTVRVIAGGAARDALQRCLRERGIESGIYYPAPIHRQPLFARMGYGDLDLPVAQRLSDEVLSLPVHPALSAADIGFIAESVTDAVSHVAR